MRLLIFFLVFSCSLQAQTVPGVIPCKADFFYINPIGQLITGQGSTLQLFPTVDASQPTYSYTTAASIRSSQPINAFKHLVFHYDTKKLVILDNTLSVQGEMIALENLQAEDISLACPSYNNGFWVYLSTSKEAVRYNHILALTNRTNFLPSLAKIDVIHPTYMQEEQERLFVVDSVHGIFIFDKFGAFERLLPIKGLSKIHVNKTTIYFQKEDNIVRYDLLLNTQAIRKIGTQIKDFCFYKNALYVLTEYFLLTYSE